MDNINFMGYKVNKNIKYFTPNTVLFSNDAEKVTVAMVNDVLDYYINIISHQNPLIDSYQRAKKVFSALKMMLDNKQPPKQKKEDLKLAVDVLEEIKNQSAKSTAEKDYNARCALICKLMIDGFAGGIS